MLQTDRLLVQWRTNKEMPACLPQLLTTDSVSAVRSDFYFLKVKDERLDTAGGSDMNWDYLGSAYTVIIVIIVIVVIIIVRQTLSFSLSKYLFSP